MNSFNFKYSLNIYDKCQAYTEKQHNNYHCLYSSNSPYHLMSTV